jgi:DNA-binding response OmpR family regulator
MSAMSISPRPCCLIVEDEAVIALSIETSLEDGGMVVAGPFASSDSALAWTRQATPDVALLDFKLKDGTCTEVALTLLRRGVPVVIYSGLPKGADTPPELRDVTWIEKPLAQSELLEVLVSAAVRKPTRAPS